MPARSIRPSGGPQLRSSLDEGIPSINVHILRPEIATVTPNDVEKVVEKSTTTVSEWLDWLKKKEWMIVVKKTSSKLVALKQKNNSLFKKKETFRLTESRSDLP